VRTRPATPEKKADLAVELAYAKLAAAFPESVDTILKASRTPAGAARLISLLVAPLAPDGGHCPGCQCPEKPSDSTGAS
jgi:hypothetical protein